MSVAFILSFLLAGDAAPADVVLDRPVLAFKTGKEFHDELQRPLTASRRGSPLRATLRQIAASNQVALLLDRDVDPTLRVTADFNRVPLQAALAEIAAGAGAATCIVGDTLYIGPPRRAAKLRTLAALRFDDLGKMTGELPQGRLVALGERRLRHWNDLNPPTDVLRQIGEDYELRLEGLDRVPHDLWASATLPKANAVEALSLVLIQFDLTFEWSETAEAVRLVPVPENVAIDRSYTPRSTSPEAASRAWMAKIEGLQAAPDGRQVNVSGTVEQHEALAALLNPSRIRPPRGTKSAAPVPLSRRTYPKLKFDRVPAIALIRFLEKTGIVFEYDEQELADAGIDLNTKISMDLKDVSADDVFTEFCKPLGLKFSTNGVTVKLSPR